MREDIVMIISIVNIPTLPHIDKGELPHAFKESAPKYARATGLIAKFYTVGEESTGGVFFWRDKAAAQLWYTDPWWRSLIRDRYRTEPTISHFDVPVCFVKHSNQVISNPESTLFDSSYDGKPTRTV